MESIWSLENRIPPREALSGDIKTEIAVIGAGMAGILIANALREAGRKVVVLEAGRIAGGQTRNTTAKITSQHGMIYETLTRTLGRDTARLYGMANEAAGAAFRRMILARNIDCSYEEKDAFVCGDDAAALRAEAAAAARLGLPAMFVPNMSLPFKTAGAVRFSRQAQFDPLAFLRAVSDGLTIFEHTPVRAVRKDMLLTDRGTVRAEKVVFATHYPFVNFPGLYFARIHQERSYVIALKNAPPVPGMFITAGSEAYSFRTFGGLLLIGGGGHRTGGGGAGGSYALLRRKAAQWYPGSREVARWSAQDCMTPDSVPYIGRYAALRPNWYVATGFRKWGMTSSMVAAMLIRDEICGEKNPFAPVFRPGRFGIQDMKGVADEMKYSVRGLARRFFGHPAKRAGELPAGHGGVVMLEGRQAGAFNDGSCLCAVDVRCPHLGCRVEWNPDEKSWDCPCHGSRFDRGGGLISGPAQRDLDTRCDP